MSEQRVNENRIVEILREGIDWIVQVSHGVEPPHARCHLQPEGIDNFVASMNGVVIRDDRTVTA